MGTQILIILVRILNMDIYVSQVPRTPFSEVLAHIASVFVGFCAFFVLWQRGNVYKSRKVFFSLLPCFWVAKNKNPMETLRRPWKSQ